MNEMFIYEFIYKIRIITCEFFGENSDVSRQIKAERFG